MQSDYIATENVERFLDMLRRQHLTPEKRTTLQKLLIDEESKLARTREHLELAERRVHEGSGLVAKMKNLVANAVSDADRQRHDIMLRTMETTQTLLEEYHRLLRDELFPFVIMLQSAMVGHATTLDEARQRAQAFANANPTRVVTVVSRSNGDSQVVVPE